MCKIREEFEEWANGRYAMAYNADGSYYIDSTADAWEVWQASRYAIRVDLPHLFPFYREGVTEALSVHGIKVNQWKG